MSQTKIFARIRPPGVSDIYASDSQQRSQLQPISVENQSNSKIPIKPSIKGEKPSGGLSNASSLDKDYKCCIFTSSSKDKSSYVAVSGNPIKK